MISQLLNDIYIDSTYLKSMRVRKGPNEMATLSLLIGSLITRKKATIDLMSPDEVEEFLYKNSELIQDELIRCIRVGQDKSPPKIFRDLSLIEKLEVIDCIDYLANLDLSILFKKLEHLND